jgi:hypothetical protein
MGLVTTGEHKILSVKRFDNIAQHSRLFFLSVGRRRLSSQKWATL